MEKMNGATQNLAAENIAKIKELFPACVDSEGGIDFAALKTTLGAVLDENDSNVYRFTWNGKEKGRAYALAPSMGTLRPDREKSVDFDATKNLYIEGDNLEVLKLLRGAYAGRIKMIYIDPPYNTGKDFVYDDDYSDSIDAYKKKVGLVADNGTQLKTNTDSRGRYHTNWLNMIFPRLLLARDLLAEDGAVFISIDDNEIANLRKLCDEVFGEQQFQGVLIWKTKTAAKGVPTLNMLVTNHDYILVYAKNSFRFRGEDRDESEFLNPDNDPRGPWKADNMKSTVSTDVFEIVDPNTGNRFRKNWAFSIESIRQMIAEDKIIWPSSEDGTPRQKKFLSEMTNETTPLRTLIGEFQSETATNQLKELFDGQKVFDFPKQVNLIKLLVQQGTGPDATILDFFSGSGTTAHAVMALNTEDGGRRHFIMVQLPEPCAEGTVAAKVGYKNICEIGEERIRRAAAKIKKENPLFAGDLGFKVFTLDSSNVIPWNSDPTKLDVTMRNAEKNLIAGRTDEDVLFEILLKKNIPLDVEIKKYEVETEENGGKTKNTLYVAGGLLFVCLDKHIPGEVSTEILRLRDALKPDLDIQVVFLETGFTDVDKTNALAILEQGGVQDKQIWTL